MGGDAWVLRPYHIPFVSRSLRRLVTCRARGFSYHSVSTPGGCFKSGPVACSTIRNGVARYSTTRYGNGTSRLFVYRNLCKGVLMVHGMILDKTYDRQAKEQVCLGWFGRMRRHEIPWIVLWPSRVTVMLHRACLDSAGGSNDVT